jgi:putative DNA primase/helicase
MITKVENIPVDLKGLKQWVCWVGKDKIPKNAYTGKNAQSNNPDTWADFDTAVAACSKYNFDGVGFMFANGYFGVDLDHCIDNVDFCDEFVETLQSYAEISKSGTGIHIICRGTLPSGARRKNGVEMYSSGRYFICTGNIYNEKYRNVVDCTESVKVLHSKYLPSETPRAEKTLPVASYISMDDQEVVDKARNCKSGYLFTMLYQGEWQGVYSSQSEADLALCNMLAFWTQKDPAQMDRIFRSSGLMRPKWEERRGANTYGQITVSKACMGCTEVYNPTVHDKGTDLAFAVFKNGQMGVDAPKEHYDLTDTGNAHRLCDKFGHIIRYSYNRKKWYYWDGKTWRLDDSGEIKKLADMVCDDIKQEAFMEQDEDAQVKMLKWANRTASSHNKENMIKECQHLDGIPVGANSFDSYPDFFNCQNGIVNLRNGELIPHESSFMMSKIAMCDYDVSGKKPEMWLRFLDDVTAGDKELQEYIQRCVGYSLGGSTREQCAYFLYGMGNNGKSTFLDTIADMLGDYAANTQPETIMMKRFGNDSANSDVARLKGARYVTCEEPTEGVRLNEGLLKQLTGGSKITCRFLYGDEFEYTPEFKIWVATNHKPVIRGTDVGIWRRIKLIPFEVNIPPEKVDKHLKYKLRKEMPQILHWAVEGCIKWQREGISEPACVQEAVKEYKNEMDLLTGFIEDAIVIDYTCNDRIMAKDLFTMYIKWAKQNNEYEMTSKKFFKEIAQKLPEKGRVSAGIYFSKIRFTDYAQNNLKERQYSFEDFKQ